MPTQIFIDDEEIRLIAHAINFVLNLHANHGAVIALGDEDRQILRILSNELVAQKRFFEFTKEKTTVELSANYRCEDGIMRLAGKYFGLITNSVSSFYQRLHASPKELEILTGAAPLKTRRLLETMKTMADEHPPIE